ncbi:MAG: methylmalonyl Co-A mutase-associated GTPase MeaB [Myxococcota bacterium]|nr:methylmalonyl Co-A mutase-associated GTPase MeaB [Myxococcota bacterium]
MAKTTRDPSRQAADSKQDTTASADPASIHRPLLDVDAHVTGVLSGDRSVLAQTITLVESNASAHQKKAQAVLKQLLPHAGNALRVGITGVPGVGKSTFVDALGTMLTGQGHQVAVLAIDPSSSITGGSILGDKTRMERLACDPNAFIRPSPTGGALGGVAKKSRETLIVCEAAGFDVVFVETVGVGQSEITVRSMVDFFLLLMLPGAGDALQGIKRGVMELADALVVNKADGDNAHRAGVAKAELDRALPYLQPATRGWKTGAHTCSSLEETGIAEIWAVIRAFEEKTKKSQIFFERRKAQSLEWLHSMIDVHLRADFYENDAVRKRFSQIEHSVVAGDLPVTVAIERLFAAYRGR